MKRLLAQFGFAALAMVLSTGAALADTTVPGNTAHTKDVTSVATQSSDPVNLTNTQAPTQAVDSAAASDSVTPTQPSTASDKAAAAPIYHQSSTILGTPSSSIEHQAAPTPVNTAPAASPSAPTPPPAITHATTLRDIILAGNPELSPGTQNIPATTRPTVPTPSQSSTGLLDELQTLLTSALIPLISVIHAVPVVANVAVPVEAIILISLALSGSLAFIPVNSYTARLRRAGFLGAARSDVGGASLLFATPLEMGCIPVPRAT